MSESSAEGGTGDVGDAPLSDAQFSDYTTSQSPGMGIAAYGFYPAGLAHQAKPVRVSRRRRKPKHKK